MKKLISLLLCLILVLGCIPATAEDDVTEDDPSDPMYGLTYSVENGEITITGYNEHIKEIVDIPWAYNDMPVVAIADYAFSEAPMKAVRMPPCKLGEAVFFKCRNLISAWFITSADDIDSGPHITYDNGKTLYYQSQYVHSENLVMPDVETILYGAASCLKTGYVSMPSAKTIGEFAFTEAEVKSFHFMNAQDIGEKAFSDARFEKAYFADVKKIESRAFENAHGSVVFYCDAPQIADDAFADTNITIYYAKGCTGWDELNINAKEIQPEIYHANFYAEYEDKGRDDTPILQVDLKEGMTLTYETIPEFPEIEGYMYYFSELNFLPAYGDISSIVHYRLRYTVHIKFSDGLTGEVLQEYDVVRGTEVEFPDIPVHEGYRFLEWVNDFDLEADSTSCMRNPSFTTDYDRAFTATYEAIKPYVLFADSLVPNAYSMPDDAYISALDVEYGHSLTESEFPTPPEHEGYRFTKWSDEGKNITEELRIIYALYEPYDAKIGDANTDGKVNTADAVYVLRFSANMLTLTEKQLVCADTNKDGKVNTADAALILKYAAGMITDF